MLCTVFPSHRVFFLNRERQEVLVQQAPGDLPDCLAAPTATSGHLRELGEGRDPLAQWGRREYLESAATSVRR